VSFQSLRAKVHGAVLFPIAFAASCARGHNTSGLGPEADGSMSIYALKTTTLEGDAKDLAEFRGKVTLLVNVASYCGNTPQYTALERVHKKYEARGFSVLGFPSNDFGAQEPGTPEEIRKFCSSKYQVTFPLFTKVQTKGGAGQSPIYAALEKASGKLPSWNFGKYLVGRDGRVIDYFTPSTDPEDAKLTAALEKALAEPAAG
jgi:glutathione peroxidase